MRSTHDRGTRAAPPGCAERVGIGAALSIIALSIGAAVGCAGELPRGEGPIRGGSGADGAVVDGALDGGPVDGQPPDGQPPDAGSPPARALWLVVRDQPFSDGVRARLQPPHHPTGLDPRAALPEAALLVEWIGPARAEPLVDAWAEPRPAGVWYPLGRRIEGRDDPTERRAIAVADASWLAARLPEARQPLRWRGAPLVVVDGPWDGPTLDAFAAARDRVAELGVSVTWGAVFDPAGPGAEGWPPPGVAVVLPRCAVDEPAARTRARQALAPGIDWLPCLSPPSNPRLDDPRAAADDPHPDVLRRRLILARRVGAPVVVVDGVGAWRDDRQLDPVAGAPTGAPLDLTTGLLYRGEGDARIRAVRGLLLAPARADPAGPLADPPVLLDLVRTAGVIVERLESGPEGLDLRLSDATGRGRYEVLLDDRPFVVPPDATLRYRRSDPAVALDLVFADGVRLGDVLADDGGLPVARSLAPFVGRRVEEVTLVYAGGRDRLDARISDPEVAIER